MSTDEKSHECGRCGSKVYVNSIVCEKCKHLWNMLRSKSAWFYFSKGLHLVYFNESGSWVFQPQSLAEHNRKLGKDTFEPSQINEKWCPKNFILEIKCIRAELEESESE